MTSKSNEKSIKPMTPQAARRIQSATAKAKAGDGAVPKGSFAARAASAATKNSK